MFIKENTVSPTLKTHYTYYKSFGQNIKLIIVLLEKYVLLTIVRYIFIVFNNISWETVYLSLDANTIEIA